MIIGRHAIKRYKRRIGKKHANRRRIVDDINYYIENYSTCKYKANGDGYYKIETPKFTAVCFKNTVVTLYDK